MSISTITIGADDYTSYASVAEADIRLAVDPTRSAAWALLTTDQKGANLVAATNRLDLERYVGAKTNGEAAQPNQWPRTGVSLKDGTAASTVEVPFEMEVATILLAGSITLDASNANSGTSGSNVKGVKAGSAEVQFFQPTIPGVAVQDETVFDLIKCFLEASVSSAVGMLTSGEDQVSSFSDPDKYGKVEGYP